MSTQLPELCSVKDACFTEKAGRTTIYQRIKEGHYEAFKLGRSTRLSVASIKAYRQRITQLATAVEGSDNG